MNAPLERSTAPKPSLAHSGSVLDTEMHSDVVERLTARIISQASSKQFQALKT